MPGVQLRVTNRWEELYTELTASEAGRIEARRSQEEARKSRDDLFRWSRKASRDVLTRVRDCALERAKELRSRAGIPLEVSESEWSKMRPQPDTNAELSAEIGSLRLSSREQEITLYTHCVPGRLPTLHYLVRTARSWPQRERNPRLITIPGCRIVRAEDDSVLLRVVDRRGASSAAVKVDDLVFRGFELLLRPGPFPWSVRFPMTDRDQAEQDTSETSPLFPPR